MTLADRTPWIATQWRELTKRLFHNAMDDNIRQISRAVARRARQPGSRILDLGCWDGATTRRYLRGGARVFGVELAGDASKAALKADIVVTRADLNMVLPFQDESFDAVTSNQVIEHLSDTDTYLSEIRRVLRPGGLAIVSTENLASWHNIMALLLGWQAFSLTNVSIRRAALGNPFGSFRDSEPFEEGWGHMRVFSYRGLRELLDTHGLVTMNILGAGYYPLPTSFAHIDVRHAAFITAVARRPA
jgi:SAM-dependent methyltransferase